MIIHICGMPGVGKLTIAKHLETILSGRLIDNHVFVDLAQSICDRDVPDYIEFLKEITSLSYSRLKNRNKDQYIIFTNALAAELPEDIDRINEIRDFAQSMEKIYIPVLVVCTPEENAKRVISENRSIKRKLRNPDILHKILSDYTPAHDYNHPNNLIIDNTNIDPESAAQLIAKHCQKIMKQS